MTIDEAEHIPCIAYFSMEIGLESAIPTYAGGLGVLAGDTLRSAADAGLPMVAMTLLSRKGYFHQLIDDSGWQREEEVQWPINDYLKLLDASTSVQIEDRQVKLQVWRYDTHGVGGQSVPVYLLDSDVEGNSDYDRTLTSHLYGGDEYYRLCQEVILGIGGVRMLRAMGYHEISRYHMNEGHSSLLIFELLNELISVNGHDARTDHHMEAIKRQCVFTTHTPVAAGHDKYAMDFAYRVLKQHRAFQHCGAELHCDNELNLTFLAMNASHYINGVAKRHREISAQLFEGYHIDSITNGVHAATWVSTPLQQVFDNHIPDWRQDNASLRYAISLPAREVQEAHRLAKRELIEYVNKTCNAGMDFDDFTLGFARRATPYKRATLIFTDTSRLQAMTQRIGPLQIIFAGKAHPNDTAGKELIHYIHRMKALLDNKLRIAYLPDYDMRLAKMITAGVDVWLNTPQPPLEASGTSGMKAALNGVPSLSVLDGWWIEGCIEGVTGWSIGDDDINNSARATDAESLYDKLENIIMPMFYQRQNDYLTVSRHSIAINGSFFNTERMINQYVTKAYFK